MLKREQIETMLDQVLEIMTAIAYNEPVERVTASNESKLEKVNILAKKADCSCFSTYLYAIFHHSYFIIYSH